MQTRYYYYGPGEDHLVELTPAQAMAFNKFRIMGFVDEDDKSYAETNLTDIEILVLVDAAAILQAYLDTHKVDASPEWMAENPPLRPAQQ